MERVEPPPTPPLLVVLPRVLPFNARDGKLDWELLLLRPDIESFEDEFTRWLETPGGRFETWYAERARAG